MKLSKSILQSYIQTLDPSIFGLLSIENILITSLKGGNDNLNFIIELNNRSDRKFVAKLHPNSLHNDIIKGEYEKLIFIGGMNAPKAIYLGKLDTINSHILFMEFIKGKHKVFNDLKDHEVVLLADVVAKLHSKVNNRYSLSPGSTADKIGTFYDYLKSMVKETITDRLSKVNQSIYFHDKNLIEGALQKLNSMTEEYKVSFCGTEFSLLHMDIIPLNVIWLDDDIKLIDWSYLSYGDRANEVAYIFAINNVSRHFQEIFLDAYQNHVNDKTFNDRLKVHMLRNKLDDLAWSIEKIYDEESGKSFIEVETGLYKKFYEIRLKSLIDYLG